MAGQCKVASSRIQTISTKVSLRTWLTSSLQWDVQELSPHVRPAARAHDHSELVWNVLLQTPQFTSKPDDFLELWYYTTDQAYD